MTLVLVYHRTQRLTIGDRAFTTTTLAVWNSIL